ncbi:MAG: hypothetical protein M1831_005023 [Alyxoria varia]|nr:MAG: hypothetical protein M1831_005023 [Alyxoria varia]
MATALLYYHGFAQHHKPRLASLRFRAEPVSNQPSATKHNAWLTPYQSQISLRHDTDYSTSWGTSLTGPGRSVSKFMAGDREKTSDPDVPNSESNAHEKGSPDDPLDKSTIGSTTISYDSSLSAAKSPMHGSSDNKKPTSGPLILSLASGLIENAHMLTSAEAFLPHFEAVISIPNLTITDAMHRCHWKHEERVNFQYTAEADWYRQLRSDEEINAQRALWQTFIRDDMIPYEKVSHRFSGKGIVVVAGNGSSKRRLEVLLRVLNEVHSRLPVEVHYYKDELDTNDKLSLQTLYHRISFSDLSSSDNIVATKTSKYIMNYNLKPVALLNSKFAEPLLLDSDNLPAGVDPANLYASQVYREFGTIFWPDIARTRPQNPIWALTNTQCRKDEYEQESGQLLVNKAKFWYHLQLAAWFNHRPDEYYTGYGGFLLGDKDTFRFAWHALKTKYGKPKKWLASVGFVVEAPEEQSEEKYKEVVAKKSSQSVQAGGSSEGSGLSRDLGAQFSNGLKARDLSLSQRSPNPSSSSPRLLPIFCGHSFAQHHPDTGEIQFLHGGLLKTIPGFAIKHLRSSRAQNESARTSGSKLFSVYKRSPVDENHRAVERTRIKWWDAGVWVSSTGGELDELEKRAEGSSYGVSTQQHSKYIAQCTDFPDVIGWWELDDAVKWEGGGFEALFEKAGGMWVTEQKLDYEA